MKTTCKHIVMCDNQNVRETDTIQEAIAYTVRLMAEAKEAGLVLDCRIEDEKNDK